MKTPPTVSAATPTPPDWLSRDARRLWNKKIEDLAALDLLHLINLAVLAKYCSLVVQYSYLSRRKYLNSIERKTQMRLLQTIYSLIDELGLPLSAQLMLIQRARGDQHKSD